MSSSIKLHYCWLDAVHYFARKQISFRKLCLNHALQRDHIEQVRDVIIKIQILLESDVITANNYVTLMTLFLLFERAELQALACKKEE
jgi:hypothetical protein